MLDKTQDEYICVAECYSKGILWRLNGKRYSPSNVPITNPNFRLVKKAEVKMEPAKEVPEAEAVPEDKIPEPKEETKVEEPELKPKVKKVDGRKKK